jgi:hypothetical protein
MEYNRIVAVTGMPGLYELVSSKSDGAIVRSLEDGTTKFVSSRIHNLSHLESIEVYTVQDNVNLAEVLTAMKNSGEALPDTKDNKIVKSYFEKVYPDLDFERVYSSDMKKMIKWLEVLQHKNVEIKLTEQASEESEKAGVEEDTTPVAEEVTVPEAITEEPAETLAPKKTRKKKSEE